MKEVQVKIMKPEDKPVERKKMIDVAKFAVTLT
jgi:hypothetical protein